MVLYRIGILIRMANYFKKLWHNAQDSAQLQKKYQALSAVIVAFGGLGGLMVCFVLGLQLADQLGIDPNAQILGQENSGYLIAFFILTAPVFIFLGAMLFALVFGTFFALLGVLSFKEAVELAVYSKYPRRWMKPGTYIFDD